MAIIGRYHKDPNGLDLQGVSEKFAGMKGGKIGEEAFSLSICVERS